MKSTLAIDGGTPVRSTPLPYGRQSVSDEDIAAVVAVLRSDWLTTGPAVASFESAVADRVGARHGIAVSNGTAALHLAMAALDVGPGDEVIVPALTFAASANCAVYQGARPRFADVDDATLLLDPEDAERKINERTRAIVGVDYAGQPCEWDRLRALADRHDLHLVADGCHALGATDRGRPVGSLADLTTFSFHPVKHIATGEGGMVTTDNEALARRLRVLRNHGITTDHRQREEQGSWFYEMVELGYNYRLTDFQCALGESQLSRLDAWLERRRAIAARYDRALGGSRAFRALAVREDVEHAYHLYVVRTSPGTLSVDRSRVFAALRAEGIGVNVHYVPVHLHPFYRERFGTEVGDCPNAEAAYDEILSLPMFPAMGDVDVDSVLEALTKIEHHYGP